MNETDFVPLERAEQALRSAATLITERGWVQGMAQDEAGRLCLIGAIVEAVTVDYEGDERSVRFDEQYTIKQFATQIVERLVIDTCGPHLVSAHNDCCLTSGEQAAKLLNDAANLAFEGGRSA